MADQTTPPSLDALAWLAARQAYGGPPDRLLLDRFAADRDEAAFAALVERHGAVVLDAARAVLRHEQDAEDVFQAAFLVLARKAETIRKRDALGCWLHGVTRRIALRALRARARRARHETVPRPQPASGDDLTWAEVRALIHDELARLPEALRAAVLLCHLEGLTLDEAGARLGLARGTLRGRLDRAREVLRRRLARRGLGLAALACPASVARAVPPLTVLATARAAAQFATGVGEPTRAAALANGVMSMTTTYLKLCLMLAVILAVVGLGVAGTRTTQAPPAAAPAPRDAGQPAQPAPIAALPPVAAPKAEFGEVTVVIQPSFLSNRTRETVRVSADGTCLYEVPERPARGEIPAWPPARIVHKLPPDRSGELNTLLKGTDWLTKDAKAVMQLHQDEYELALKRDGKTTDLTIKGESQPYGKLLHFFRSVAAQEYILYRLEWVPAAQVEARRELDNLVAAELGEPFAKSPLAIDMTRYAPWATRLVRKPFGESADDVRAAVRLVGLLRLESEREHLGELASDRDRDVRIAVAGAVGRLGGEKAVPVLRKMVRSTGLEAAWELIKLGPVAVPTIAEVIRDGAGEEDMSYEWLIRAYIEHWKEVPKPLDPKVLDAVRASMATPKVKAHRTQYHAELLKLAAGADRKE
ncbi:MAG TPA: sigma-70 family RNA polymerase sigma factor [Gemmataceae bacterium]|nr:sigma-70 family RNA polymerase sigma factor [Gemmataceae bacterium]